MDVLTETLEKEAVIADRLFPLFNQPPQSHKIQFYELPPDSAWTDILPEIDHLITEDDTPVDNIPSEKQQRLLTEPLYSAKESCPLEWPFLVAANVGLFDNAHQPAIVPDVFLSLSVQIAEDWWDKRHRSYFVWEFGKVPEVVIEIVSNKEGGEDSTKFKRYGQMGIQYYVIFDPMKRLSEEVVRGYEFSSQTGRYRRMKRTWFPLVGLGLKLWQGEFEGKHDTWLRWCDQEGQLIPTGAESARQERQRAERAEYQISQERHRAEYQIAQERQRAEYQIAQERQRIEQLTAKLRELGIDPNSI